VVHAGASWYSERRKRVYSTSDLAAYAGPYVQSGGGPPRLLDVSDVQHLVEDVWSPEAGEGRLLFQCVPHFLGDRRGCLTDAGQGLSEERGGKEEPSSPPIFTCGSPERKCGFPHRAAEGVSTTEMSRGEEVIGQGRIVAQASAGRGLSRQGDSPSRAWGNRSGEAWGGSGENAVSIGSIGSAGSAGDPGISGNVGIVNNTAFAGRPNQGSRTNVSAIPTLGIPAYLPLGYQEDGLFPGLGLEGGFDEGEPYDGELGVSEFHKPAEPPEMVSISLPSHLQYVFQDPSSHAAPPGLAGPRPTDPSSDPKLSQRRVEEAKEMNAFREQLAIYEENIRARAEEDRSYELPRIPQAEYLQDLQPKGSTVLRKLSVVNCPRIRGGIVGVIVLCPSSRLLAIQIKGVELYAAQVCALLRAHPACLALGLERPSFEGDELDAAWQYAAMLHQVTVDDRTEALRAWPVFPPEMEPLYRSSGVENLPLMSLECSIQFELGVNRSAAYFSL